MKLLSGVSESLQVKRYMTLPKFLDILANNRLFFSKMVSFPDKLEGRVTPIDESMAFGGDKYLSRIVNEVWPSATDQRETSLATRGVSTDVPEYSRSYLTPFGKISGRHIQQRLDQQKHWIDVSCWEAGSRENYALWKIYGGTDNSVCVHSTIGLLSGALQPPIGYEVVAGQVRYIDENDCNFDEDELAYFMRKRDFYGYENEVRLVAFDRSSEWQSTRTTTGTAVPVDAAKMIQSVTVCPEAGDWFLQLLKDIVSSRFGLGVELKRSAIQV